MKIFAKLLSHYLKVEIVFEKTKILSELNIKFFFV